MACKVRPGVCQKAVTPKPTCRSKLNERPVCKHDIKISEAGRGTSTLEATGCNSASTESTVGRGTHKVLNKQERNGLSDYLNSIDYNALNYAVQTKLAEQSLSDLLTQFTDVLFKNELLLHDTVIHHRCRFLELFLECQKGDNSFSCFQLWWHQHCSAFLLGKSYPLRQQEDNDPYFISSVRTIVGEN